MAMPIAIKAPSIAPPITAPFTPPQMPPAMPQAAPPKNRTDGGMVNHPTAAIKIIRTRYTTVAEMKPICTAVGA